MTRMLTTILTAIAIASFATAAQANHHEGGDGHAAAAEAGKHAECSHAADEPCPHVADGKTCPHHAGKQCTHSADKPCNHGDHKKDSDA